MIIVNDDIYLRKNREDVNMWKSNLIKNSLPAFSRAHQMLQDVGLVMLLCKSYACMVSSTMPTMFYKMKPYDKVSFKPLLSAANLLSIVFKVGGISI